MLRYQVVSLLGQEKHMAYMFLRFIPYLSKLSPGNRPSYQGIREPLLRRAPNRAWKSRTAGNGNARDFANLGSSDDRSVCMHHCDVGRLVLFITAGTK